jgi:Skp family chaperone for outer membrane proteins
MERWKGLCLGAALVLAAGPALAQGTGAPAQAPQPKDVQTKAAPAPAHPFPADATLAYVDMQRVGQESSLGKQYAAQIEALRVKRSDDLNEQNKALQAEQHQLEQSESVMSPDARLKLQQDIDAKTRKLRYDTQEAQADLDSLKQDLGRRFNAAVSPILEKVALARHVQLVFGRSQTDVVWVNPAIDLTSEVVAELDAQPGAAEKKKPQ